MRGRMIHGGSRRRRPGGKSGHLLHERREMRRACVRHVAYGDPHVLRDVLFHAVPRFVKRVWVGDRRRQVGLVDAVLEGAGPRRARVHGQEKSQRGQEVEAEVPPGRRGWWSW